MNIVKRVSKLWTHAARIATVVSIGTLMSWGGQQTASTQGPQDTLIVRISAGTGKISAGQPLKLRVEIRNTGDKPVFVGRDISDLNETLSLFLKHGSEVDRSMSRTAGDFLIDKGTPLATLLSQHWIVLGPGNFYGGEAIMDTRAFPRLCRPGKYLINGEYKSHGFGALGEGNPLRGRETEIGQLPFTAWEGRVETNSIWVEVTKSAGRSCR